MREPGRACDPPMEPEPPSGLPVALRPPKMRVPTLLNAGEPPRAGVASAPSAVMMPVPVSSVSRPVASSPARISSATMMKLAKSDEPPWLMKGRVTPVSGIRRVTPPTMRNAWKLMAAVRPVALKAARSLFARAAVVRPRTANSMKSRRTAAPPSRPHSSPMAEKMKSDSTTGMRSAMPRPMPWPTSPPSASEYSDCTSW